MYRLFLLLMHVKLITRDHDLSFSRQNITSNCGFHSNSLKSLPVWLGLKLNHEIVQIEQDNCNFIYTPCTPNMLIDIWVLISHLAIWFQEASGAYFFGGNGRIISPSELSKNPKLARQLWETTCNMLSHTPFDSEETKMLASVLSCAKWTNRWHF